MVEKLEFSMSEDEVKDAIAFAFQRILINKIGHAVDGADIELIIDEDGNEAIVTAVYKYKGEVRSE